METPFPSPGRLTSGESFDDDLNDHFVPSGENVTCNDSYGGSVGNDEHGVPKDNNSKADSFSDLLVNVPHEETSVLRTQIIGTEQSADLHQGHRDSYRKFVRRFRVSEERVQSWRKNHLKSEQRNWELLQQDRLLEMQKRKLVKRNRKLQQELHEQKQENEVRRETNQSLEAKLNEYQEKHEQILRILERIEQAFNINESDLREHCPALWFQLAEIIRDKSQSLGSLFPVAEELDYDESRRTCTESIPPGTHFTGSVADQSPVHINTLPILDVSNLIEGEDVHMTNVETHAGPVSPISQDCDDSAVAVIHSAAPDPIIIPQPIDTSMNQNANSCQANGWSSTAGSSTTALTAVLILIEPPTYNPDDALTLQTVPVVVASEQPAPDQGQKANSDTVAPTATVTGEPLTCETCGKTFASDSTLCRHRNQMGHGNKKAEASTEKRVSKQFKCPYCVHKLVQLSRRDALHRHVRDQHKTEWVEYKKSLKPKNKRVPLRKDKPQLTPR